MNQLSGTGLKKTAVYSLFHGFALNFSYMLNKSALNLIDVVWYEFFCVRFSGVCFIKSLMYLLH